MHRPQHPVAPSPTALRTRLPGLAVVVVLGLLVAVLGPARALGTPGEPDPVGVWPLAPEPEVVAGFDPPTSAWGSGHRGVDLLGSPGQSVRAALAGNISFVGRIAGRGIVVVDHGGTRTTYEPVAATVERGAEVAAGASLGTLETTGSHCFPRTCLHWGWIRDDTYLDPLRLVGLGPVRLLPLWRDEPVGAPSPLPRPVAPPLACPGWRPLIEAFPLP